MEKLKELLEEFKAIVAGKVKLIDTIFPALLFLLVNQFLGLLWASLVALFVGGGFAIYRYYKKEPPWYALGGIAGVILAVLFAWGSGQAKGFFLPDILTGVLTIVIAVLSILFKRPMVAWTSYLARRWEWNWYWRPKVRPAYTEVTWFWVLYFGLRTALQINIFQGSSLNFLGILSVVTGLPGTILLLVISYLYGSWRLRNLRGPSVEEFRNGVAPPWQSQRRGF